MNKQEKIDYNKTYHETNRQAILKRKREHYMTNRDAIRKRKIKSSRKYYANNKEIIKLRTKNYAVTPISKYNRYKNGALSRGKSFDLTFEQFMLFWEKPCNYCGDTIKTIGLDRVDNNKGYSTDNVVSCCFSCNRMKGIINKPDFLSKCNKISLHNLKQTEIIK